MRDFYERNAALISAVLGIIFGVIFLFTQAANAQAQSAVTGFALWDAATDTLIDPNFKDGDHIPYDKKDCVAIEIKVNSYLQANGDGSIRKQFDDLTSVLETNVPMGWEDDAGPSGSNCAPTLAEIGSHRLTVTPFDGENWTGMPGVDKVVNFVTDGPLPPCPIIGASLECAGQGSGVRCEVPADAQAVSDRQILLRLYINGQFVDYPATQQFPLNGKVYQDWPIQPTDEVYWGTCINHLLVDPCERDADGNVVVEGCKQDFISESMELGYSYGQPLPETGHGLVFGIGLLYLIRRRKYERQC